MEITDIDNRGTEEVPYGLVYFADNTRIAYDKIDDDWQFSGSGSKRYRTPTFRHEYAAMAHLSEHGPTMPEEKAAA